MKEYLKQLPKLAKVKHSENKKYFEKLKKKTPKDLDYQMLEIHNDVFKKIDCSSCANCCKTTGPLFTQSDIERISRYLRIKSQQFINQYLQIDADDDYVLQRLPCSFLDEENYCMIYEVRPKACREFPHTDRKKFHQISHLTLKNTAICPAAYEVVEEMKRRIGVR